MSDPTVEIDGRGALDEMFSVAYEELRRLASAVRRNDPGATISPTTLVSQAWLKLASSPNFAALSRLHFKRIAARAMRQVLVEGARRRRATKRGGGQAFVTFEEGLTEVETEEALLSLDVALADLSRLHPRQSEIVECRFFGGLEVGETAELLGVSEATVLRDWRAAKAWLASELRRGR